MNKSTLLGILIFFTSCKKNDLATISIIYIADISTNSANITVNINSDGGSTITQSGVCWDTVPNPTTFSNASIDGSQTGSFTSHITGLKTNTTYYVRAYAINSQGTAYSNERILTTAIVFSQPGDGVTFNGYNYSSVVLGNGQEWMAENLRTTVYANGEAIPHVVTDWSNLSTGAWTNFLNNNQYENPYGKLYNWYAVADQRNVCPTGWHVPSVTEWKELTNYLGGGDISGGKMKSTDTIYWKSPNVGATNESGFSGLPGGNRVPNGFFSNMHYNGYWWSSSESTTPGIGKWFILSFNDDNTTGGGIEKEYGCAIRCMKD